MQVEVNVLCMHTNCDGCRHSGFGDIATFKNGQISLSDHGLHVYSPWSSKNLIIWKGENPHIHCFPHLNVVIISNVQLQDSFLSIEDMHVKYNYLYINSKENNKFHAANLVMLVIKFTSSSMEEWWEMIAKLLVNLTSNMAADFLSGHAVKIMIFITELIRHHFKYTSHAYPLIHLIKLTHRQKNKSV